VALSGRLSGEGTDWRGWHKVGVVLRDGETVAPNSSRCVLMMGLFVLKKDKQLYRMFLHGCGFPAQPVVR